MKNHTPHDPGELRRRAEAKVRALEPAAPAVQSPEEIKQMLHELRVHQIELEMQNEELRTAQALIEDGQARYFDLYDLAPVGYCTLSEQGLILEANLTAVRLLGSARKAMVMNPFSHFIIKEDQDLYYRFRKQFFGPRTPSSEQADETRECELRLVKSDSTLFWAHLTETTVQAEDGAPVARMAFSDISDRIRAEQEIKRQLTDKEILLQEVNHRIKNNMNTMKSILLLQAGRMNDKTAITAFEDASNRMESMAILYDQLYQSSGFTELSIKTYVSHLADAIISNFPEGSSVKIEKHIDDIILDAKRLQPIGIIINELLTNIMKYAFIEKSKGIITLSAILEKGHIIIVVQDNGIGIPSSINLENSTGFGLILVHALAGQIDANILIERKGGTRFVLDFIL